MKKITATPRGIQAVGHILTKEKRHREIQAREVEFAALLQRTKQKQLDGYQGGASDGNRID